MPFLDAYDMIWQHCYNAIPTSDGNITGAFWLCGKGFYTYIPLSYIQIKPIIYIYALLFCLEFAQLGVSDESQTVSRPQPNTTQRLHATVLVILIVVKVLNTPDECV